MVFHWKYNLDDINEVPNMLECGTYNIRVFELSALARLFQTVYNALFEKL